MVQWGGVPVWLRSRVTMQGLAGKLKPGRVRKISSCGWEISSPGMQNQSLTIMSTHGIGLAQDTGNKRIEEVAHRVGRMMSVVLQ